MARWTRRTTGTWCSSTGPRGSAYNSRLTHTYPQWPDGRSQQIHLDLWVDDIAAAHAEVMSLGAKLLQPAADTDSADNFQVYADPAGHPFCLCWIRAG